MADVVAIIAMSALVACGRAAPQTAPTERIGGCASPSMSGAPLETSPSGWAVILTESNDRQALQVNVGAVVEVRLSCANQVRWGRIFTTDDTILAPIGSSTTTSFTDATFRAARAGQVSVRANRYTSCVRGPSCGDVPLWMVTLTVMS